MDQIGCHPKCLCLNIKRVCLSSGSTRGYTEVKEKSRDNISKLNSDRLILI